MGLTDNFSLPTNAFESKRSAIIIHILHKLYMKIYNLLFATLTFNFGKYFVHNRNQSFYNNNYL